MNQGPSPSANPHLQEPSKTGPSLYILGTDGETNSEPPPGRERGVRRFAYDIAVKQGLIIVDEIVPVEDVTGVELQEPPALRVAYYGVDKYVAGNIAARAIVGGPLGGHVLAAKAALLMCENDTSGALNAFAAADAAGITQAQLLIAKAHLLLRRSRIAEFNTTTRRMLALDPGDPMVVHMAAYHLYRAQQPLDALRAAAYIRNSFPEWSDAMRSYFLIDFAGRSEALRSYLERYAPVSGPVWDGLPLAEYYTLLRYEHRYADLRALLKRVPVASGLWFTGTDFGPVGPTPIALLRGWTDLLIGDRADAHRDGHDVLQFVHGRPAPTGTGCISTTLPPPAIFSRAIATARGQRPSPLSWVSPITTTQ